jgi:hypothetical protein
MTLTMWRDNRLPILTDTITANSAAVNLTGSTVTYSMRHATSAALKVNGATATIVSAAAGTVSYAWAAVDVDTVGDFLGWWSVSSSGKTQDTPEFAIEIVEHAPDSVNVPEPVGADGATEIYQGDSYLDAYGRALQYELQVVEAPDLTGTTVTFRVADALEKTMTVVGEDAVKVDLTSAETAALTVGSHQFEIEAAVSVGNVVTLLRSDLVVLADMDGP